MNSPTGAAQACPLPIGNACSLTLDFPVRRDHRPGCEQPAQIAFHWDNLRELVEGGRYRDSQEILGVIWSAAVVDEATGIVIASGFAVLLVLLKWDTDLRFEVLEKKSVVGFG